VVWHNAYGARDTAPGAEKRVYQLWRGVSALYAMRTKGILCSMHRAQYAHRTCGSLRCGASYLRPHDPAASGGRITFAGYISATGWMACSPCRTCRVMCSWAQWSGCWAILRNSQDCRERLERCRDESGLTHVTCQCHNLPGDLSARLEYLEGFGAEVI
jgi:hypothetical protein